MKGCDLIGDKAFYESNNYVRAYQTNVVASPIPIPLRADGGTQRRTHSSRSTKVGFAIRPLISTLRFDVCLLIAYSFLFTVVCCDACVVAAILFLCDVCLETASRNALEHSCSSNGINIASVFAYC